MPHAPIPVVDLFAGPGGLSEGFASLRTPTGGPCFDVRLSIEKDAAAHETLQLRSFVRAFRGRPPNAYYDYLSGRLQKAVLLADRRFREEADRATQEAWRWTLSEETHRWSSERVTKAVGQASTWVLIGGPPCQAYSLVGRARMRSANPRRFERDERHFLYREYLRILADHAPPVFIMENVQGILSATVRGRLIFEQILSDLSRPNGGSLRYRVVPLCTTGDLFETDPNGYLVRCENFGVPQARHRVILCGVREDLPGRPAHLVEAAPPRVLEDALSDLPPIRSRVSREEDSRSIWLQILREACDRFDVHSGAALADVAETMRRSASRARGIAGAGANFISYSRGRRSIGVARNLRDWYRDPNLPGVTGHESRFHMRTDLHRYLFAASFAAARGNLSPTIRDFPKYLLPRHDNVRSKDVPFADRFRVQVSGRPSTTIVSHIAKDGHYYIHPDPAQCRSLTLREAARLQTFPDNYHFEGTRTEQLHQVGNAVPPLIARQIAGAIWDFVGRQAVQSGKRSPESVRASVATQST